MKNLHFINVARSRCPAPIASCVGSPGADVISITRPATRKLTADEETRRRRISELEKIREENMRRAWTASQMISDLERESG